MNKVIIFGNRDFASLAHFYLKNDSEYEVVAFTVNEKYLNSSFFEGKPIIAFEEIEKEYVPSKYKLFAPLNYNQEDPLFRSKMFDKCKQKGYNFVSYISSKATIFHKDKIGENCFILENNTIQPFVTIGNNCVLWSGNHVGHHSKINDHVLLTSHVVISGHCDIESHTFFGVNSTIRDGLTIKEGIVVAMGSLVTKSFEPWSLVMGSPAKVVKVIDKR